MFDIGKIISELRKERGWTQVELASKLGVSDKAVSKWENGGGFPDITQLPVLASIFNVSIDYLMTGKKEENISLDDMDDYKRQLYLIQKDDVENYVKYGYHLKTDFYNFGDENNPKPIDAIIRNCSTKIFNICVESKKVINIKEEKFYKHIDELVKMACVSGSILFLELIGFRKYAVGDKLSQLQNNNSCKIYHNSYRHSYNSNTAYMISNETLDFIFNNNSVSDDVIKYISSYLPFDSRNVTYGSTNMNFGEVLNGNFYFLEQDVIKRLYVTKKFDLLDAYINDIKMDCLGTIKKFNDTRSYDCHIRYSVTSGYLIKKDNGGGGMSSEYIIGKLISINEDIINLAISNGDSLWTKKFVSFNQEICNRVTIDGFKQYILSNDEITNLISEEKRKNDILNDNKITDHERKLKLLEMECFVNDILDIEKVIKANDYKFAERMINNCHIHVVELVYKHLEENNWDKIIEFAELYKISNVKRAVQEQRLDIAEKKLIEALWADDMSKPVWNSPVSSEMRELRKVNKEILGLSTLGTVRYRGASVQKIGIMYDEGFATFEYAINYLKNKRIEILNNLKQNMGYQSVKDELNRNYFDSLLSNGLNDIVIIKLCVLLEGILKADFHYEGEFVEILEKYCSDNINDYELSSLLHKLRRCRNGIVHPEQRNESISIDELNQCIDYICTLVDKQ